MIGVTMEILAEAMEGCCTASGTPEHALHVLDRLAEQGYTVAKRQDTTPTERAQPSVDDVVEWLRRMDNRLEDVFGLWVQGKRDDRWVAEKLINEGHLAALIEEPR